MIFEQGMRIGDYILQELIGKGQFSVVWKAQHLRQGFEVAIKINEENDPLQLRRFQREAEILRRLNHTGLVPFYGYDQYDKYFFILMRYIEGQSLESVILERRKAQPGQALMSLPEILKLLKPLAEALDYIHSQNVIHRDLKPANILLEAGTGNVLLTDFGLAKNGYDLSQTAAGFSFTGTLLYATPEQVANAIVTPATDQYALATIIYELLTGRPPFQPNDNNPVALLGMHLTQRALPPGALVDNLPEALDLVMLRALEKEATRRFNNVIEFYQAFETAANSYIQKPPHLTWPNNVPHSFPENLRQTGPNPERAPLSSSSVFPPGTFQSSTTSAPLSQTYSDFDPSSSGEEFPANRPPGAYIQPHARAYFISPEVIRAKRGEIPSSSYISPPRPGSSWNRPKENWLDSTWVLVGFPIAFFVLLSVAVILVILLLVTPGGQSSLATGTPRPLRIFSTPIFTTATPSLATPTPGFTSTSSTISIFTPAPATVAARNGDLSPLFTINTGEAVYSLAFSADGNFLANGSQSGIVHLWSPTNAQPINNLPGHTAISRVAFSPDSKTLASVSDDKTVRVWDVASGRNRFVLGGHTGVILAVAFSPDGKTLATSSSDTLIRLWDTTTGRLKTTLKGHTDWVWGLAFSPDGKLLASGSAAADHSIRVWDLASGQVILTIDKYEGAAWTLAFSPDGKTLASGTDDKLVRLWEVATGQEKAHFAGHSGSIRTLAFSPDGRLLVSGSDDKTVRLWEVATGQEKAHFFGHKATIWAVNFAPDGKTFASGAEDGTIYIFSS